MYFFITVYIYYCACLLCAINLLALVLSNSVHNLYGSTSPFLQSEGKADTRKSTTNELHAASTAQKDISHKVSTSREVYIRMRISS